MDNSVESTIRQIIADRVKGLKVEDIDNSTPLTELGADSLDSVEIVMNIESHYKINISEDDFENLQTVNNIIKFLQERGV